MLLVDTLILSKMWGGAYSKKGGVVKHCKIEYKKYGYGHLIKARQLKFIDFLYLEVSIILINIQKYNEAKQDFLHFIFAY